jgi:hypothetical protein
MEGPCRPVAPGGCLCGSRAAADLGRCLHGHVWKVSLGSQNSRRTRVTLRIKAGRDLLSLQSEEDSFLIRIFLQSHVVYEPISFYKAMHLDVLFLFATFLMLVVLGRHNNSEAMYLRW